MDMRSKAFLMLTAAAAILAVTTLIAQSQTDSEPIEKVGGYVSPPRAIYFPQPQFSDAARTAGYQGVCSLGLVVGTDGKPRNIHVINAIGMGLDEKAIDAVRSWRFSPALKGGKPVAVEIAVEVDFNLGNQNNYLANLSAKAKAGDAKSQLEFANFFLRYYASSPEDEQVALGYVEKAANQGLARAQFLLAEHIARKDTSADYPRAYMWYSLARRGGEKHSNKALERLTSKMTTDQLHAGQALVDGWGTASPK